MRRRCPALFLSPLSVRSRHRRRRRLFRIPSASDERKTLACSRIWTTRPDNGTAKYICGFLSVGNPIADDCGMEPVGVLTGRCPKPRLHFVYLGTVRRTLLQRICQTTVRFYRSWIHSWSDLRFGAHEIPPAQDTCVPPFLSRHPPCEM